MCVRCGEMAAEVERLQGLIDSEKDAVDFSKRLAGSSNAIPLYTRPIPAQQSPAVAVTDLKQEYKLFCKWCDENQSLNLDPRLHTHSGQVGSGGYIDQKMANVAFKAWCARNGNPSPRITERDARELTNSPQGRNESWSS